MARHAACIVPGFFVAYLTGVLIVGPLTAHHY
jgi:hypothetical protein